MTEFSNRLAFIVPTKDHPEPLRRMLGSLASQSCLPHQLIVVDGSDPPIEHIVQEFPSLGIEYIREFPPSLSRQRNVGIAAVKETINLAGYLDDDLVLEPGCIEAVMQFWESATPDVGGVRFNIISDPMPKATWIKSLFMADSHDRGRVLPSGHVSMIGPVSQDKYVDWLSGGATVWRIQVVEEFAYDEWFEGTGYLEDVEYSYRVHKEYKLMVVSDAKVQHFSSPVRREMNYTLGKWQIINRMYFVNKNPEFSRPLVYWALLGDMVLNAGTSLWKRDWGLLMRAWGNCAGVLILATGRSQKIGGVYK